MVKGNIFDIVRSSIVDGPGIRTTVFLKGCNLDCKWCHNPESKLTRSQIMFYKNNCVGCGACLSVCDHNAISENFEFNREKCVACGKCSTVCFNGARKFCGTYKTPLEVFNEVMLDEVFYKNSGGGVTFSGGEPMLQTEFLVETAKLLKERGIS